MYKTVKYLSTVNKYAQNKILLVKFELQRYITSAGKDSFLTNPITHVRFLLRNNSFLTIQNSPGFLDFRILKGKAESSSILAPKREILLMRGNL